MALKNDIARYTWWVNLLGWGGIGLTVVGVIFGGISQILKSKKEDLQAIESAQKALEMEKLKDGTAKAHAIAAEANKIAESERVERVKLQHRLTDSVGGKQKPPP